MRSCEWTCKRYGARWSTPQVSCKFTKKNQMEFYDHRLQQHIHDAKNSGQLNQWMPIHANPSECLVQFLPETSQNNWHGFGAEIMKRNSRVMDTSFERIKTYVVFVQLNINKHVHATIFQINYIQISHKSILYAIFLNKR